MVRVFANGPGDLGSIPGWVIPKTQKLYLMPPYLTLNIIKCGSRVKWSNPRKGVAPSPTPRCRSYRKESPQLTLYNGGQLYLLYIYKQGLVLNNQQGLYNQLTNQPTYRIYIYIYIYIYCYIYKYRVLIIDDRAYISRLAWRRHRINVVWWLSVSRLHYPETKWLWFFVYAYIYIYI